MPRFIEAEIGTDCTRGSWIYKKHYKHCNRNAVVWKMRTYSDIFLNNSDFTAKNIDILACSNK